jgi:hypothetical protein
MMCDGFVKKNAELFLFYEGGGGCAMLNQLNTQLGHFNGLDRIGGGLEVVAEVEEGLELLLFHEGVGGFAVGA